MKINNLGKGIICNLAAVFFLTAIPIYITNGFCDTYVGLILLIDERGKMISKLDLTDDQAAQIEAVRKERAIKIEEIKKKNIIAKEKRRKMKAIREEYAKKLETLLNTAQKEKLHRLRGDQAQYNDWLNFINSLP